MLIGYIFMLSSAVLPLAPDSWYSSDHVASVHAAADWHDHTWPAESAVHADAPRTSQSRTGDMDHAAHQLLVIVVVVVGVV